MPRSIDTHKDDCACPACQGRRGERPSRSPMVGVRIDHEAHEWLHGRPEGARRWIEDAVARARSEPSPTRTWWYDHIERMVIAAWREVDKTHPGATSNPSSVAKRVAAQLAEEVTR